MEGWRIKGIVYVSYEVETMMEGGGGGGKNKRGKKWAVSEADRGMDEWYGEGMVLKE